MTNSLSSETNSKNFGVFEVVEATVDITSLANAGNEPWDPNSNLSDVDDYDWVIVLETENDYHVEFDHTNDQFTVTYYDYDATTDGQRINVPSSTDVGTVDILVIGRR